MQVAGGDAMMVDAFIVLFRENKEELACVKKENAELQNKLRELEERVRKDETARLEKDTEHEAEVGRLNALNEEERTKNEKLQEHIEDVKEHCKKWFRSRTWPPLRVHEIGSERPLLEDINAMNRWAQPRSIDDFAVLLVFALIKCPTLVLDVIARCNHAGVILKCMSDEHSTLYTAFYDMLQMVRLSQLDFHHNAWRQFIAAVPSKVLVKQVPERLNIVRFYLEAGSENADNLTALYDLINSKRYESDRCMLVEELVWHEDANKTTAFFNFICGLGRREDDERVFSFLQWFLYHGARSGFHVSVNKTEAECAYDDDETIYVYIARNSTNFHLLAGHGMDKSLLRCLRQHVVSETMEMTCKFRLVSRMWLNAAGRFDTSTMRSEIKACPPTFKSIEGLEERAKKRAKLGKEGADKICEDALYIVMCHILFPRNLVPALWWLNDAGHSFTELLDTVATPVQEIRPTANDLRNLLAEEGLDIIRLGNELCNIEQRMNA